MRFRTLRNVISRFLAMQIVVPRTGTLRWIPIDEMKNFKFLVTAMLLALMSLVIAYAFPYVYFVNVGASQDTPFVSGFYEREDGDAQNYRWSSDKSTLIFPGITQNQDYQLDLILAAGPRPASADEAELEIVADDKSLQRTTIAPELRTYTVAIPAADFSSPDLRVELRVPTFNPHRDIPGSKDERELGVIVAGARLHPHDAAITWLALPHPYYTLGWLVQGALFFMILARTPMARRRWSLWPALLVGDALMIGALGFARAYASSLIGYSAGVLALGVIISRQLPGWLTKAGEGQRFTLDYIHTLGIANSRFRSLAELVSVVGIAGWFFFSFLFPLRTHALQDFLVYYTGATLLWRGGDYYDPAQVQATAKQAAGYGDWPYFNNSPFTALLFAPLALMSLTTAKLIWVLANFAFLVAGGALVYLALRNPATPAASPVWLALMLAFSRPLRDSLGEGQVGALVFFLFALGMWAWSRERARLAGAVVATAAAVKVFPVLWLGYMAWKRSGRAFVAGVVSGLLLLGAGVALAGVPAWITFFTRVFPAYSGGMANVDNQSPGSFILRLTPGATLFGDYDPFDNPSSLVARIATIVLSLAILAFAAWWIRKNEATDRLHLQIEFVLVIPIMLLTVPLVWDHYLMWLIIPMYLILHTLANRALSAFTQVSLLVALGTSWVFLQFGRSWYALPNYPVLLMSLGLYATISIFIGLIYLKRVETARPAVASKRQVFESSTLQTQDRRS